MKAIKSLLAIVLGVVMAVVSACTPEKQAKEKPKVDPPPAAEKPAPPKEQPATTQKAPDKLEDLPIRAPILE